MVVVKGYSDVSSAQISAELESLGVAKLIEVPLEHAVIVRTDQDRVPTLADLDSVRWIEPPGGWPVAEASRALGHLDAWPDTGPFDGTGTRVAVMESGHVWAEHPDFDDRVSQPDGAPSFPYWHTTMVAGLIAGTGAASAETGSPIDNAYRGVAPGAFISSFNFAQTATTVPEAIAKYVSDLEQASSVDGADISNNFWGTPECDELPYGAYVGRAPIVDWAVRGELIDWVTRPIAVVFSAGNTRDGYSSDDGTGYDCITHEQLPYRNFGTLNHPKSAKNALVVGAVDSQTSAMTVYSAWGPTADVRLKPDVVAGGHHGGESGGTWPDIISIANVTNQQYYRSPTYKSTGELYGHMGRTSAAAALASGSMAVVRHAYRKLFPGTLPPLPSTLRGVLVHTARGSGFHLLACRPRLHDGIWRHPGQRRGRAA